MDNWQEYAPYLIIAISFFTSYKIFVTPKDLELELEKKLEKYVLKETYNLTVGELKTDISEMKEKIDKMYDKLINA